ncbi:MAG: GNAT family N-acetyltransferase [Saprospiraceae bacterium]|nr:GNAT family N-acetyltransferase [Saprospiraceae bacterium]
MITILQAQTEHLDALTSLFDAYRVWYKKPSDLEGAKIFLAGLMERGDAIAYLAQAENGEFAGFTQLYPLYSSTRMKRIWVLNDLYVKPEYRGQGISKLLIDKAKDLARATDAVELLLETGKDNDIGNSLYPSVGFERNTEFYFYYWTTV